MYFKRFHSSDYATLPTLGSLAAEASDKPSETSPLLHPCLESPYEDVPEEEPEEGDILDLPPSRRLIHSRSAIIWVIMAVVVFISCGEQIMEAPMARTMESVLCYEHFEAVDPSKIQLSRDQVGPGALGGVAERYCKGDAVQSQLAMLRGYQQFFDGFPSLILALPFGWAADRYGRKPFILLGLVSFILRALWTQIVLWFWQSFDIKLTWLSSLHGLMGGSQPVVVTILFVVLSDVTHSSKRAAVFIRVGAANIFASLLMPPVAAWLMMINPWIPSGCGTLLFIVATLLYIIVPETRDYRAGSSIPPTPAPAPGPFRTNEDEMTDYFTPARAQQSRFKLWISKRATQLKQSTSFLTHDWRVPVLIALFLGHQLIGSAGMLLLQYCSKRYNLTFSQATLLLTIFSGVKVVLCLLILPFISGAVMKYLHYSTMKKDLYLTRISFILISLGWVVMAASPNIPLVVTGMVIASLGQGGYLLMRSYLTSLVPSHHIARVFSIVSIFDTVGAMLGGPLLSALFQGGISLGGSWIGLPFYFIGLITFLIFVMLCIIRLRQGEGKCLYTSDEDDA